MPTAIIAIFLTYCSVQYLTGDKGFFSQETRQVELAEKQAQLQKLSAERKDLEARARYLRTDNLSKELLEERARVLLGLNAPNEYVIRDQNPSSHNS
ncbi:septum formation initiator [Asticcacaulis sp. YBE204]|nr:septum formation initiator family protein [Asticcacaulis aquaticus]ESQ78118.1 septum formation initiator [Asticcacaulis sp. YBE204]